MRTPNIRTRRIAAFAAGPIAVVAAGALVFQGSNAAFEAETRNAGNVWATGELSLTNDSNGSARFQANNMVPGDTQTKCIKVTSNATVPGTVKFYFLNPTPTPSLTGLDEYIDMSVEEGSGGDFSTCTGFTADGPAIFDNSLYTGATANNSWATAVGDWSATVGSSKTYRLTWTFDADAPDDLQGHDFGIDFEWEMQTA